MADRRTVAVALVASLLGASCAADTDEPDDSVGAVATDATTTVAPATSTTSSTSSTTTTTVPPTTTTTTTSTTSTTTTTTSTTSTTTTTTATTVPPTTTLPPVPGPPPIVPIDPALVPFDTEVEIGRSVNGLPITVVRRGDPTGTRVLAVGVIHGNEAAGVAVIDRLRTDPVPPGVELWLVRSMNPDGEAIGDRRTPISSTSTATSPRTGMCSAGGFWQYGGTGPASEPETQAMVALGSGVRPEIVLWYHQDPVPDRTGQRPSRRDPHPLAVAGLPIVDISGGTYTGTAAQWARMVIPDGGVGITLNSKADVVGRRGRGATSRRVRDRHRVLLTDAHAPTRRRQRTNQSPLGIGVSVRPVPCPRCQ
ncbi:MAG: hypothetical protein R2697_12040 [Ilumatobacteraceae bacterium]